jgi:lipopolysaccharide/colanic/teichoic acid biosynthesis glycosyltransferase
MAMPDSREWRLAQVGVACADAAAIAVALLFALAFYPHAPRACPLWCGGWTALHEMGYICLWLALIGGLRLYDYEHVIEGFQQYAGLVRAAGYVLLLTGLLVLVGGDRFAPRHWLLAVWLLSISLLGIERWQVQQFVRYLRRRGILQPRVLIVGAGEDGLALAEQLMAQARGTRKLLGFLDEYRAPGSKVGTAVVLGEPLALAKVARDYRATEAIIVPQAISWESLQILLQGEAQEWGLQQVWLAPAYRDLLTTGLEVQQHGTLPLVKVARPRISGLDAALKRGLDLALSLLVLPIALPLCLIIAGWLTWVRRLPPLDRQPMVGCRPQGFTLYTFPPLPALQRWHLWRLPALLNILRGDLSLVGPRPINRELIGDYRPWRMMLSSVRPGLTGPWWLMSGSWGRSIAEEVGVDLSYIRNYTLWTDLRVLALTLRRLVLGMHAPERESAETQQALSQPELVTSGNGEER